MDALTVDVGVRVRVARRKRRYAIGGVYGDDAVTRLDVGAVELQAYAVGRADLEYKKFEYKIANQLSI